MTPSQDAFVEKMKDYIDYHDIENVTEAELDLLCRNRDRAGNFFILTRMQLHAMVLTSCRQSARSETDESAVFRIYPENQYVVYEQERVVAFQYVHISKNFPWNRLDVSSSFFEACVELDKEIFQEPLDAQPTFIMFSLTRNQLIYQRPNSTSGKSRSFQFGACKIEDRSPEANSYRLPGHFGKDLRTSSEEAGKLYRYPFGGHQRVIVNCWPLGIFIDWQYSAFSWMQSKPDYLTEDCQAIIDFRDNYGAVFDYC